jgi:hypothetical protein
MTLSVKAFALTVALLWGGAVFVVDLGHMIWPGYGAAFLEVVRSLYPGYELTTGVVALLVGTVYAFLDGLVGGAIFAWLYNAMRKRTIAAL